MNATALASKVEAPQEPQEEKKPVGTCCPGVYLAKDSDGNNHEVEVVWRPDGKKNKLNVLLEGSRGVSDEFVPVEESGLEFLARISGIRPNHYEMLPD